MKKTGLLLTGTMLVTLLTGCGSSAQKYESLVTLDVNPSIQLQLDDDEKVVDVVAGNEDAKKIIKDMDLDDADANVAINAVLGSLVKEGYLTTENNTVLLSVENDDDDKRESLEDDFSEHIQSSLKEYEIDGAILSQSLDLDDDIEEMMKKYDISAGKAVLIEKILEKNDDNKTYKIEDLVKLNAQELILIYQNRGNDDDQILGNVATSKYFTSEQALDIALQNAGQNRSTISNLEIDYDSDDGVLTYEIEFNSGSKEYEYEVSAIDGIIKREVDNGDDTPSSTPSITPNYNDDDHDDYDDNDDDNDQDDDNDDYQTNSYSNDDDNDDDQDDDNDDDQDDDNDDDQDDDNDD